MKNKFKLAFTLAEVLIVMGIIGIVAEMVIPDVVADAQKQIVVSQLKEAYSLLSQSASMINTDCGGDIRNCFSNFNLPGSTAAEKVAAESEIINLYKQKLSIIKECYGASAGCYYNNGGMWKYFSGSDFENIDTDPNQSRFVLKNGLTFSVQYQDPSGDVLGNRIIFFVDINGGKSPNMFGKDLFIFYYNIYKAAIVPNQTNDCIKNSTGFGCAAKILQDGAINYY